MKHSKSGPSRMSQGHRRDQATAFMIFNNVKRKRRRRKKTTKALKRKGGFHSKGQRPFKLTQGCC